MTNHPITEPTTAHIPLAAISRNPEQPRRQNLTRPSQGDLSPSGYDTGKCSRPTLV